MFNCCSHGTFLHFGLQSSHLNICTQFIDYMPIFDCTIRQQTDLVLQHNGRLVTLKMWPWCARVLQSFQKHQFGDVVPTINEFSTVMQS